MSEESMLQALEHTADQVDRLAEIVEEFLTLAEARVPMSATTSRKYETPCLTVALLRRHQPPQFRTDLLPVFPAVQ